MSDIKTISQLYPSKWLKAADLPLKGGVVTIEACTIEEFRKPSGKMEPAMVLDFAGKAKRLICNKTQLRAIEEITGTEAFADWPGQQIHIKPGVAPNKKPTVVISRPAAQL